MTSTKDQITKGEFIEIQYGSVFDYMSKNLVALKDFSMKEVLEEMVVSRTKSENGFKISSGVSLGDNTSLGALVQTYKNVYEYDISDQMHRFLISDGYATPLKTKCFEFGDC